MNLQVVVRLSKGNTKKNGERVPTAKRSPFANQLAENNKQQQQHHAQTMARINLQRLPSNESEFSNPSSTHKSVLSTDRGVDTAKCFPNTPALGPTKTTSEPGSGSGSGSDDTATASHDVSEEDCGFSQGGGSSSHRLCHEHKTEDIELDEQGSIRSNMSRRSNQSNMSQRSSQSHASSTRLRVAVTVQRSSSSLQSLPIYSARPSLEDAPVSLPNPYASHPPVVPVEVAPAGNDADEDADDGDDEEEATESFQDEEDSCCSDTQEDAPSTSLLNGLFASVPQTPEEAANNLQTSATEEEEKTEEKPSDLLLARRSTSTSSLSQKTSSLSRQSSSQSSAKSIRRTSSSASYQTASSNASRSPSTSPPSVRSVRSLSRGGGQGGGNSPPLSPGTNYTSPPSSPQSAPATGSSSSSSRALRRSKNGGPPPPPLLATQDSNESWDMEADDVLTDMSEAAAAAASHLPHPHRRRRPTALLLDQSTATSMGSQLSLSKKLSLNAGKRSVEFSHVHIRNYNVCIGDNPYCSYGPPLALDWDYQDDNQDIPLDVYEQHYQLPKQAQRRRSGRNSLLLTYTERRARLWRCGYSLDEIDKVAEDLEREKWRKSMLGNLEPLYRLQEVWVLYIKPVVSNKARKRRELDQQLEYVERQVREEHNSQSGDFSFTGASIFEDSVDHHSSLGGGGGGVDLEKQQQQQQQQEKEAKAVLIEGIASLIEQEESKQQQEQHGHRSASLPTEDDTGDGTHHKDYGIRVDKKQNDKATEIILCSLRRPHMRAFHASWFSFFVAFFSWFSIAPLLSEVQESLGLDKADIWMSSLFATAGTIVFRVLMGPACDAWGARVCMSIILAASAIPTALTGLVHTSVGLSLVRLFIGLAGSSFVACQYWTSDMFSRGTAGTANALVAGWGNFGGGVANVVMGSALFPLFRWFYSGEDEDGDDTTSSELAWRTIFVVPATLSLVTAGLMFFYCDDSPTGSYQTRIRNESLLVANPMESLRKSVKNWNVWILTLQYACCFGVEVTMTNATALYFKDEFGQSTVSAAGIASVFGFMNLFARGLGGFCSDKFQNMHGVKGRLFWQMLTLILEGIGVGIFGFADSLAGSIIALIFLSCMVQSAEGSTFGIVPYVDRRFTGSVVGIVGSGGNFGAVIFAVFFVYFSYTTAFILMGLSAIGSAFLSFLMKTEKLAQTHEAVAQEIQLRKLQEQEEEGKKRGVVQSDGVDAPTTVVRPQNLERELNDELRNGESRHVDFTEV